MTRKVDLDSPYAVSDREDETRATPVRPADEFVDVSQYEPRMAGKPSAQSLKNPMQSGWLSKRGVLYGCYPIWKKRWFILKGAYIFKYENQNGSEPKGLPISVLMIEISTSAVATLNPDPQWPCVFTLSTLRKDYTLASETAEDRDLWIAKINQAKALAIKQNLGHAPISQDDRVANENGDWLNEKRLEHEREESVREHSTIGSDIPPPY